MKLSELADNIGRTFDLGELRDLCFRLEINYDELAGGTLSEKVRELVQFCDRHGRLDDLVAQCQELRPHETWELDRRSQPETAQPFKLSWQRVGQNGLALLVIVALGFMAWQLVRNGTGGETGSTEPAEQAVTPETVGATPGQQKPDDGPGQQAHRPTTVETKRASEAETAVEPSAVQAGSSEAAPEATFMAVGGQSAPDTDATSLGSGLATSEPPAFPTLKEWGQTSEFNGYTVVVASCLCKVAVIPGRNLLLRLRWGATSETLAELGADSVKHEIYVDGVRIDDIESYRKPAVFVAEPEFRDDPANTWWVYWDYPLASPVFKIWGSFETLNAVDNGYTVFPVGTRHVLAVEMLATFMAPPGTWPVPDSTRGP